MAIEGIPMPDGRPAFLLVDGHRETRRKMGEAGKSLGRGATARTRKPASLSIRREPSGRNKPATCSGSKTERYRHGRRTRYCVWGMRLPFSQCINNFDANERRDTLQRISNAIFWLAHICLCKMALLLRTSCVAFGIRPLDSTTALTLCIAWQKFDAAFGQRLLNRGNGRGRVKTELASRIHSSSPELALPSCGQFSRRRSIGIR